MDCYLCKTSKFDKVDGIVRDVPDISILKCRECGLIFLENFDHINDDFYEKSKMIEGEVTIESWRGETHFDDLRRFNLVKNQADNKRLLDFGTGNGQFLEMMKKVSSSVTGVELDETTRRYLTNNDVRCVKSFDELDKEEFDVITAFHVLEHLSDPIALLKKASSMLSREGKIVVEVPNSDDALLSLYSSKEFSCFTYWGCHLMYFNEFSLKNVITAAGLKCRSMTQIQRYPLSNHLYWLSHKKPGGHKLWNFLNSEKLEVEYQEILRSLKMCDTIVAEITL